jgi:hypothetical protein
VSEEVKPKSFRPESSFWKNIMKLHTNNAYLSLVSGTTLLALALAANAAPTTATVPATSSKMAAPATTKMTTAPKMAAAPKMTASSTKVSHKAAGSKKVVAKKATTKKVASHKSSKHHRIASTKVAPKASAKTPVKG